MKRRQVVHPADRDHEAATRADLAFGDHRDFVRFGNRRVLGAVDEPGDVATVAVHEAGLLEREPRDRRQRRGNDARRVEHDVVTGAVQPDPDVVLRRRNVPAGSVDGRERFQRRRCFCGRDPTEQIRTEPDDEVEAAGGDRRFAQAAQRGTDRFDRRASGTTSNSS